MTVTNVQIFIASRFEEFAELRLALKSRIDDFTALPIQAVDLNDNLAGHAPPLGKCLAAVKNSEVMILLIGETYGGSPPGEELSYTHLEYRAAMEEDSNTVVLPFFISSRCAGNKFNGFSPDRKLAAWQKELIDTHTTSFLDSASDTKEHCIHIFDSAFNAIYEARPNASQDEMDSQTVSEDLDLDGSLAGDLLQEPVGLSHGDMERLDSSLAEEDLTFESAESSFKTLNDILLRPAEAAALEQKNEALKAIELGDRYIAVRHLRKALEFRPLDLTAAYWLARLLVSTRNKKSCRDAIRYALLAAKMASYEKRPHKASVSYMMASKAAGVLLEFDEALDYAQRAVHEAPWLATARVELASQMVGAGRVDEALDEIRRAFISMPEIILKANKEPSLVKLGKRYQDFKRTLRETLLKDVSRIISDEVKAHQLLGGSGDPSVEQLTLQLARLESRPLLNLCLEGRQAVKRQLNFIRKYASSLHSADSRTIERNQSSRFEELERAKRINEGLLENATGNRKTAKTRMFVSGALTLLLLLLALSAHGNNLLLFVLLVIGVVAASYSCQEWQNSGRISEAITDLERMAEKSGSVMASITSEKEELQGQAAAKAQALCAAIATFEKHVTSSQVFRIGKSIKAAKPGDLVTIDTQLQENVLKNALIYDVLMPDYLAVHSPAEPDKNGRMKVYRLVECRNGQPVLSRSAVYFDTSKAAGMVSKAPANSQSRPMLFEFEKNGHLFIKCPSCGKSGLAKMSDGYETNSGYKLNSAGTCACGMVYDEIYCDNKSLLPDMVPADY